MPGCRVVHHSEGLGCATMFCWGFEPQCCGVGHGVPHFKGLSFSSNFYSLTCIEFFQDNWLLGQNANSLDFYKMGEITRQKNIHNRFMLHIILKIWVIATTFVLWNILNCFKEVAYRASVLFVLTFAKRGR